MVNKQASSAKKVIKTCQKTKAKKSKAMPTKSKGGRVHELQVDTAALDLALSTLAQKKVPRQNVMEFYSCPRLVEMAARVGLKGSISLDVVHGWDGCKEEHQKLAAKLLTHVKPDFLMTSPPSTYFSPLMEMWNFKKMSKAERQRRKKAAFKMVDQAWQSCLTQHDNAKLFCFEHPANATSWSITLLKEKMHTDQTYTVLFDQCAVGLKSPLGAPMKKRTRLWTNSPGICQVFSSKQCNCTVEHRRIEGSEGGFKLSKWAQKYPPMMVKCLLEGAKRDMNL